MLGPDGWPDFESLQYRIHVRSPRAAELLAASQPVTYLAFDLLHLDGWPLLDAPYHQRRRCWIPRPCAGDAPGVPALPAGEAAILWAGPAPGRQAAVADSNQVRLT